MHWYNKPFAFTTEAIFIGSLPLPGIVDADSVEIVKDPDTPDQWLVSMTFVTGVEPKIGRGVTLDEDGRVTVEGVVKE